MGIKYLSNRIIFLHFLMVMACCVLTSQLAAQTGIAHQSRIEDLSLRLDSVLRRSAEVAGCRNLSAILISNRQMVYGSSVDSSGCQLLDEKKIGQQWPIGSLTKQFCAYITLKLEEEKVLDLNTPITIYCPEFPNAWSEITLRHLLSHTSGIKDYLAMGLFGREWPFVLDSLAKQPLDFSPGTAWSYCNTGYWLTAQIIERVTGQKYSDILDGRLFSAIGIQKVSNLRQWSSLAGRMEGINGDGEATDSDLFYSDSFRAQGDGDLVLSMEDLIKWISFLSDGKNTEAQNIFTKMVTPGQLNNGLEIEFALMEKLSVGYGLGWFATKRGETPIFWTPGALPGHSTSIICIPEKEIQIIVFCNKGEFRLADQIGFSLLDVWLEANQ